MIAVCSDVHGNHLALQCCLEDARRHATQFKLPLSIWCLGDVSNGMGGTSECLEKLDELADAGQLTEWLIGNHDLAQLLWWPDRQREPLERSKENEERIRPEALQFVQEEQDIELLATEAGSLDVLRRFTPELWQRWTTAPAWAGSREVPGIYLAHGLIVDPDPYHPANTTIGLFSGNITERLEAMYRLLAGSANSPLRLVVTGHTHIADAWSRGPQGVWSREIVGTDGTADYYFGEEWYELSDERTWVLNAGSVGWQKDKLLTGADPATVVYLLLRAATDRLAVCFRRPSYDLNAAIDEYRARGIPEAMLDRLRNGI